MTVDLVGPATTPALSSWMEMLTEAGSLVPANSKLTAVELPDGVILSDDPEVRAIQLVGLYRSGVIH